MSDVRLEIGGDTRKLESEIKKTLSKPYTIELKTKGQQPLGRINSELSEFNKSLEASNARVLAFGASAGAVYGIESAFQALVASTIEVEKALTDINVILNASASTLKDFGDSLFNIAKGTGQSFAEVAAAATEFSRQGLGVEETLKRTNQALILSRLSGLDAAKSVEALTAAVNSYASAAVTTTEIVNKFANVDAAFAVSSADLAEALSRVGSSAAQSGVSLDELIAIVTSAQQTTARGGAVIGNSFKTIFTRLQRGDVLDQLSNLGIDTTDANGNIKSTIQLLVELASVYDDLNQLDQAAVAESVGGVFQINILKAALADLGKEYSIYSQALGISASSTDEAIQRNEALNQTLSAQLNALKENAKQVAANVGTRLLGPSMERVVGGANTILGGINEADGQGLGATLGRGILDGLGQVISGPGLALLGGVIIKLFKDFTVYAGGSVKEILGLNTATKQQADIQKSINALIAQNPGLLALMQQGTLGINQAATTLLNSFKQQTLELQKQDALTAKIAAQLYKGGVRVQGGVPTVNTKTKADGYIPAFAKESRDVKRGVGGAKSSDKAIGPFNINGEPTIINSGEKLVPNFGGSGETAILTRDMQKSMSMAMGYIPNFAVGGSQELYNLKRKTKRTPEEETRYQQLLKEKNPKNIASPLIDLGSTERLSLIYGKKETAVSKIETEFKDKKGQFGPEGQRYKAKFKGSGFNPKKAIKPEDEDLIDGIGNYIVDYTNRYTSFFGSDAAKISSPKELSNLGSLPSIAGTVFETAVTKATNSVVTQAGRKGGASAIIDFVSPNPELRELFNNAPGDYEAKISKELAPDVIRKGLVTGVFKAPSKKGNSGKKVTNKAKGYIPNFANPNLIQEVSKRANLLNSNITNKLKEGSGLKDEAYIKAAQKLGVNVTGLDKFMTPMSFPLKGKDKVLNLSKALGTSFGRSFTLDALKMGDWDYVKPQFESAGYTKDDFSKLSKFASTPKGASALKFWKSRASGFIPNFAARFGPKTSKAFYSQSATPWDKGIPMTPQFDSKTGAIYFPTFEANKNKPGKIAHSEGVAGNNLFSINQFQGLLDQQKFNPRFWSRRSYEFVPDKSGKKVSNKSTGFIPNFANRKVGYLDGDVLSDPRYASIVEAQIQKLGLKGGTAEYHKYLGDLAKKARKTGSIQKFTGIFGVPGAGKSTMMLGGKSAQKADNAKARKTERIPIIRPEDIGRVDQIVDTRASLSGTMKALEGGYWSGLDRLMIMSSSTPEEQKEIKRRRNLRDSQILQGKSDTAFGRSAGTSQGAALDSGYIEAMALSILGPNKTRVMGINENFKLKRKTGEELPLVEKKQIGLAYGAFSPATKGHLQMMEDAKRYGISPQDFIVAISKEGGKIDPKDMHSFRTAIFDQKTRKYLAKKTFSGANVIGANSELFTGGSIPRMFETDPVGSRRRFLSAKSGSMAFVGSDKQQKDLEKYKNSGYKVQVGERTPGISGTDARAAILAGDSKLISKIFAGHVVSTINEIGPNIRNRSEAFPEILSRVNSKIDKRLDPILAELSTLPSRITKSTPEEVALKIQGLREQRDKYLKLKQIYPNRFLKKLGGIFPQKYGIPNAAEGYIPNFADPLNASINRELDESGLPKSQIYVAQKDALINKENPAGLGVFNKRDEGSKLKENKAIKNRSKGYVPNFAETDVSAAGAAIAAELGTLAFVLAANRDSYKNSLEELTTANQEAILKGRELSQLTESEVKKLEKASKGTLPQKLSAGASTFGSAFTIAAPIIANTISNAIDTSTKEGRVNSSLARGAGTVTSFAGTGAMIGSAIAPGVGTAVGAGVGALAGAALAASEVVGELNTDIPELIAAAQKSSESLTKLDEGASGLKTAYDNLEVALKSGRQDVILKAQEAYAASLEGLTPAQKEILASSKNFDEATKKLAELRAKEAKQKASAELGVRLGDKQIFKTSRQYGQDFLGTKLTTADTKTEDVKQIKTEFVNTINSAIKDLQIKQGLREKFDEAIGDVKTFEDLNRGFTVLEDAGVYIPEVFKKIAQESNNAGVAAQIFSDALSDVSIGASKSVQTINSLNKSNTQTSKAVRGFQGSLSGLIGTLSTKLASLGKFNFEQDLIASRQNTSRELKISETLGFQAQVATAVGGQESDLTIASKLLEENAKAMNDSIKAQEDLFSNLRAELAGTFTASEVFGAKEGEAPNQLVQQIDRVLAQSKSLEGQPDAGWREISELPGVSELNDIQKQALSKLESITAGGLDPTKFYDPSTGQIDQKSMTDTVIQSLQSLGVTDQAKLEEIRSTVEAKVTEANQGIIKNNDVLQAQLAINQQNANQTKRMADIMASTRAFGGAEEYLNPSKLKNPLLAGGDSENINSTFVESIRGAIKQMNEFKSTTNENTYLRNKDGEFRFNNKDTRNERDKNAPEYGRNILNIADKLTEVTGGLYKLKPDSTEYKAIVEGNKTRIDNELKALKDYQKTDQVKQDPMLAKMIGEAIKSVKDQGTKNIAQLQVWQKTGQASPETLVQLSKLNQNSADSAISQNLQRIMEATAKGGFDPKLLADKTLYASGDATTKEVTRSNTYLAAMTGFLSGMSENLARVISTPPTQMQGGAPATTMPQLLDSSKLNPIDTNLADIGSLTSSVTSIIPIITSIQGTLQQGIESRKTQISGNEQVANSQNAQPIGLLVDAIKNNSNTSNEVLARLAIAIDKINAKSENGGGDFNNQIISAIDTGFSNALSNVIKELKSDKSPSQSNNNTNGRATVTNTINLGGVNVDVETSMGDLDAKLQSALTQLKNQILSQIGIKTPPIAK
jgi:TP901 family phage tail tape measure protein